MQKRILIVIIALVALFSFALTALAEALIMNLRGGDSVEISCENNGSLNLTRINKSKAKAQCKAVTQNPTNTPIPPTKTPVPPTNTPIPTSPPNTPTPTSGTPTGDLSGKECPAWVHDLYVVPGPDGKMYPTWHPQIDPQYRCYFTHEHGDDPTKSLANSSLPAFGYVASLAGFNEPHEGFKIFVTNAGYKNNEGRVALDSSRVVAHMGTGGTGRYLQEFHSLQVDLVGRGREFHIQQMSDTGDPGSLCDRSGGRDFVTLGCDVGSLYEIWSFEVEIGDKLSGTLSTAAFDPILVRDPNDDTRKVYTLDVYGKEFFGGFYRGCQRENYSGPYRWSNGNGTTTFKTDAFGELDPNGVVDQMVSKHNFQNYTGSSDGNTTFKRKADYCASKLGLLN